eukprot:scaffold12171_cov61-Phaeocystis_antarctica.AAC.6
MSEVRTEHKIRTTYAITSKVLHSANSLWVSRSAAVGSDGLSGPAVGCPGGVSTAGATVGVGQSPSAMHALAHSVLHAPPEPALQQHCGATITGACCCCCCCCCCGGEDEDEDGEASTCSGPTSSSTATKRASEWRVDLRGRQVASRGVALSVLGRRPPRVGRLQDCIERLGRLRAELGALRVGRGRGVGRPDHGATDVAVLDELRHALVLLEALRRCRARRVCAQGAEEQRALRAREGADQRALMLARVEYRHVGVEARALVVGGEGAVPRPRGERVVGDVVVRVVLGHPRVEPRRPRDLEVRRLVGGDLLQVEELRGVPRLDAALLPRLQPVEGGVERGQPRLVRVRVRVRARVRVRVRARRRRLRPHRGDGVELGAQRRDEHGERLRGGG